MTQDDYAAFGKAMTLLSETLGESMSPGRIEGYWIALEDLSIDEVRGAVRRALREQVEYFPKPGKLREYARPPVEYVLGVSAYAPAMPAPVERPALTGPVAMAEAIAGAMALVEGSVEAERERTAPKPMTDAELADRRALLRAQAAKLRAGGSDA